MSNKRDLDSDQLCWYCGKHPADKKYYYPYEMHKLHKRGRSYAVVGISVKSEFLKKTINIPRCYYCSKRQNHSGRLGLIIAIMISLLSSWYFVWSNAKNDLGQKIIGTGMILIFIGTLIFIISSWLLNKYIFNPNERSEESFPEISQFLNDGWEKGSEPYLRGDTFETKDK